MQDGAVAVVGGKRREEGEGREEILSTQTHSACSYPFNVECSLSTAVLHPPGLS